MACVKEGGTLLADKAYDTDAIRKTAADQKYGPIFHPNPTARASCRSHRGFIVREIWLSGSSTASNTIAVSQRVTTRTPPISWQLSNSSLSASGALVYESTS